VSRSGVAVVGIGYIGAGRFEGQSVANMANAAVTSALDDAGLDRGDIDGLFIHVGQPRGLDYDEVATLLGLEVRMAMQPWNHGRFGATTIGSAWMAVECRLVDYALCVAAWRPASVRGGTPTYPYFHEAMREGGGPHTEVPLVTLRPLAEPLPRRPRTSTGMPSTAKNSRPSRSRSVAPPRRIPTQ
jgi:acetyl-CoA acetyltransferase